MNKIKFGTAILMLACSLNGFAGESSKTWDASPKAKQFVKDNIVIEFFASPYGVGFQTDKEFHDYMDRQIKAGITGTSATIGAARYSWDQFEKEMDEYKRLVKSNKDKYIIVKDTRDFKKADKDGKYAFMWDTQTSSMLEGDLKRVKLLSKMGIKTMQIVYNDSFDTGHGSLADQQGKDSGLTDYGKRVIDEIVKYNIILDLSHTGEKTSLDAIEYMKKNYPGTPVILSHSIPLGLYENEPKRSPKGCYRNVSDELIKAVVSTGGMVSPTFTEWMMDGIWPDNISPSQAADMIDYLKNLIGVDAIGIASDDTFMDKYLSAFIEKNKDVYNDDGYMVSAFEKGALGSGEMAKFLPGLTDELWKRGYTDEEIKKIYGLNKMKLFKKVWGK